MCVGFTRVIYYNDATIWSRNYNMCLASGMGGYDSIVYANSLTSYGDSSIRSNVEKYKTNSNLKIGNYATSTSLLSSYKADQETIAKDYLKNNLEKRNILNTFNIDNIEEIDFSNDAKIIELINENNEYLKDYGYVISRQTFKTIGESEAKDIEYIDVKYKIEQFETNASYLFQIENENLSAIYENNIEKINDNEEMREIKFSDDIDYNEIINDNTRKILQENISEVEEIKLVEENPYFYYLDLDTKKKYIVYNIVSEINREDEMSRAAARKYIEIE